LETKNLLKTTASLMWFVRQFLFTFVIDAYRHVVYAVSVSTAPSVDQCGERQSCRMRHAGTIMTLCQCDTTIRAE